MSLSALIRKRQPTHFATATVATFATVQPKPRPSVATVASVAVANEKTGITDNGKPCSRWLFHFADRDALPVMFAPAVDHEKALAYYPDAVAAEPIPERLQRTATKAEALEITALIRAVFPDDNEVDCSEALAAALADPDGALLCYRTIAKDRGIAIAAPVVGTVKACRCCQHFVRPGKSDGYCGGRDDLPLAYGENHPMRRLPVDRGASCDQWQASE
jgi:hypothetical protein